MTAALEPRRGVFRAARAVTAVSVGRRNEVRRPRCHFNVFGTTTVSVVTLMVSGALTVVPAALMNSTV